MSSRGGADSTLARESRRGPGADHAEVGGSDPLAILIATRSAFGERLLRGLLETEHEDVVAVQNGVEAMDRVTEDAYDVVVLDRELPIKDGIDTANAISEERPEVGIVLLADDEEAVIADAQPSNVDEIVVPPFQYDALLTACRASVE